MAYTVSKFLLAPIHVGSEREEQDGGHALPARDEEHSDGDTSDLVLDFGGTTSFTETSVYLGSLLHRDLSDHHGAKARIKRAPMAFGELQGRFFGSRDVPERLKGKVYTHGALAVLIYGRESWCLTAASVRRLCSWHNK